MEMTSIPPETNKQGRGCKKWLHQKTNSNNCSQIQTTNQEANPSYQRPTHGGQPTLDGPTCGKLCGNSEHLPKGHRTKNNHI